MLAANTARAAVQKHAESDFELADIGIEEPIREEIRTVINNFEPRVRLRNVDVSLFPEDNAMDVSIVYDIVGLSAPQQAVTFILQPTRY